MIVSVAKFIEILIITFELKKNSDYNVKIWIDFLLSGEDRKKLYNRKPASLGAIVLLESSSFLIDVISFCHVWPIP